jgi:hypothetical protein
VKVSYYVGERLRFRVTVGLLGLESGLNDRLLPY